MKKYVMFALMLLACTVMVRAKANAQEAKVPVPYDFVAGGRQLHAGTYIVTRESSGGALRVSN